MIGAQACAPPLIGIAFLGSSQWSIRSAQCCISFVREPKARAVRRPCRISVVRRGSRRRSDLLWVGARAIVLPGHLLDCVVRNSEIRRDRLISRCQQKYQQIAQLELIFYHYFQRGSKIFLKIWNRTTGLSKWFYWY